MIERQDVLLAQLDDGRIVQYDTCSITKNGFKEPEWEYLGQGVIHSVNGIPQQGLYTLHFFRRKP